MDIEKELKDFERITKHYSGHTGVQFSLFLIAKELKRFNDLFEKSMDKNVQK